MLVCVPLDMGKIYTHEWVREREYWTLIISLFSCLFPITPLTPNYIFSSNRSRSLLRKKNKFLFLWNRFLSETYFSLVRIGPADVRIHHNNDMYKWVSRFKELWTAQKKWAKERKRRKLVCTASRPSSTCKNTCIFLQLTFRRASDERKTLLFLQHVVLLNVVPKLIFNCHKHP